MLISLIVEFPRESKRRDFYDGNRVSGARAPPRRGVRLRVVGIPDNTSWQVRPLIMAHFHAQSSGP